MKSVAGERVFPIVELLAAKRATQSFLQGIVFTAKSSHKLALAVHYLVAIQLQSTGSAFVQGDFVDDVLVVAGRIRYRALRFAFPRTDDFGRVWRRVGLGYRGVGAEKKNASKETGANSTNKKIITGLKKHDGRISEIRGISKYG